MVITAHNLGLSVGGANFRLKNASIWMKQLFRLPLSVQQLNFGYAEESYQEKSPSQHICSVFSIRSALSIMRQI